MRWYALVLVLIISGCGGATLTTNGIEGTLDPSTPTRWKVGGSSGAFEVYKDSDNKIDGALSAVILSTTAGKNDLGTLSQTIAADKYAGQRVRFSGHVKTSMVKQWAGLWLRVDSRKRQAIAFDNMQDRSIRGTTEWTRYDVVLNVPEDAAMMLFGVLLVGTGQVWLDGCSLEIVDDDVPTTGNWMSSFDKRKPVPQGLDRDPLNMDLER